MKSHLTNAFLTALSFAFFNAAFATDPPTDWTQWRGGSRDSKIAGEWPETLSTTNLKKVWSKPFGPSYSGPIIAKGLVFVTETKDKKSEIVTALDVNTGEKKWSVDWSGSMKVPFFAAKNGSWIRATPATDGERLYIGGIKGLFVCLDVQSGKQIWKVDLNERYGTSPEQFGHVCSPLIPDDAMDNSIYIQCSAGFIKMNRLTGKEIWRTLNGSGSIMSGGAFSSPIVATLEGQKQLVVQTRQELAGVDMASGKVLWKQAVPAFRGMNILTPTVVDNKVFTSSYNNKSFGYVISKDGNSFVSSQEWSSPSKAYMSSPVVIDGHAYLHLQNKQIACFDIEGGTTKWVSKNRKRFGDYWSMIGCGDKILALDSKGVLYLMKANPEKFEMLGEVKLDTNDSWAHVGISGDRIFVRGLDSLTAYDWKN